MHDLLLVAAGELRDRDARAVAAVTPKSLIELVGRAARIARCLSRPSERAELVRAEEAGDSPCTDRPRTMHEVLRSSGRYTIPRDDRAATRSSLASPPSTATVPASRGWAPPPAERSCYGPIREPGETDDLAAGGCRDRNRHGAPGQFTDGHGAPPARMTRTGRRRALQDGDARRRSDQPACPIEVGDENVPSLWPSRITVDGSRGSNTSFRRWEINSIATPLAAWPDRAMQDLHVGLRQRGGRLVEDDARCRFDADAIEGARNGHHRLQGREEVAAPGIGGSRSTTSMLASASRGMECAVYQSIRPDRVVRNPLAEAEVLGDRQGGTIPRS